MATKIQIDIKGLDRIQQNFAAGETIMRGAINRLLRRVGKLMVPGLKSETPVRSGKLRATTIFQIKGGPDNQTLEIRQGAKTAEGAFYGEFVREGTAPHVIRPKRAKALRFVSGGQIVFARQVNHPGTRANRYHLRALKAAQNAIDGIVAEETERVAAEFTR